MPITLVPSSATISKQGAASTSVSKQGAASVTVAKQGAVTATVAKQGPVLMVVAKQGPVSIVVSIPTTTTDLIPSNALVDRFGEPILDRNGNFILVR